MSICKKCQGRGVWREVTHNKDGIVEFVWRECTACNMTGLNQDADEGDDFDIGGSSYADEG